MTAVYYALSCVLGYLLGSISISILISRHVFHQDVRQSGSGNAGATNVARVFGLGAGVLTFLGDFAKTLLAAWLGSLLGGVIGVGTVITALLTGPIVQFFMPRTARLLYSILRRLTPQAESA